jgi:hypothetical protein
MSFNRLSYDNCAYTLKKRRSADMGDYRLYPGSYENCNKRMSGSGIRNAKSDVSTVKGNCDLSWGALTETESKLTIRSQRLNQCNTKLGALNDKVNHKAQIDTKLDTTDSRFSHPLCNYRGLSTINYQIDPVIGPNPQHHISCDALREGHSTRLWARDNYTIPKAAPMKIDSILPKSTLPMPKYKGCGN